MLSDHGELADAAARAEARKCEPHEEKAGFILRLAWDVSSCLAHEQVCTSQMRPVPYVSAFYALSLPNAFGMVAHNGMNVHST